MRERPEPQLLFADRPQPRQTVRFVAKRLWIRMGAPWNLDAQLNAKTVQLTRTVGNVLVTGTNLTPAP